MADFSSSGILDLPNMTSDTLQNGDPRVLNWILEAAQEGDRINRDDPSFARIEAAMQYISGAQERDPRYPSYLTNVTINESRKAIQTHVSALTDIKPLFSYKTLNPAFQAHCDLLNKLVVSWWITTMADLALGDCIKYALAAGTGDIAVEWDPFLNYGGDNLLVPKDPRDTLAIRPTFHRSIQLWEGVVLREAHSLNTLRAKYPGKAHLFVPSSEALLSRVLGKFRTTLARLVTPADTLAGLEKSPTSPTPTSPQITLFRAYLDDRTVNLTTKPIAMGIPGAAYAYVVQPKQPLYPRKRLIVCTDKTILYDGPNTYDHGLYPVARLKLWDVPWQFLGIPLFNDLLPLQDVINENANDIRLTFRKTVDRDVVYDRSAVSDNVMKVYDSRKPAQKIKVNPSFGDGIKFIDPPQLPVWGMEWVEYCHDKFDSLSGRANLEKLLQLRQAPSGDTLEKYNEALTPELRQEGRMIEAFLRDLAVLIKGNIFQYESQATRKAKLGAAGVTLEDFDLEPTTLVPAMKEGDPGYEPALDYRIDRAKRAEYLNGLITFVVAPNSLLAMNAQEQQMKRFQLARMGFYDFWSLMESLEIPNVGSPPPIPLPPLQPPPPEIVQQLQQQAMVAMVSAQLGAPAQPPMAQFAGKTFTLDPQSGQVLEIRVPSTITERLMAQSQLGLGMTNSPAGRKASGQEAPHMEKKGDGRQVMSESK